MSSNQTNLEIRLRQIQYWIEWLSAGFASGAWDSMFLGRGFDFQGIAPFNDDPDLVRLNWQASLVYGELQVSQFSEERNVDIYLLADFASSMAFGSLVSKRDRLALLSAILAFSAFKMKDSFHFVGYSEQLEKGFPRGRDKSYPLVLARAIMEASLGKRNGGLFFASQAVLPSKSLVIIASDFWGDLHEIEAALGVLASRHEVLPLVIWDEREISLPNGLGFFPLRDLETDELSYVFLSDKTRKKFRENSEIRREALSSLFGRFGMNPYFLLSENDDDIQKLIQIFFLKRKNI